MESNDSGIPKGGEFLIKESDPKSVYIPEEVNEEEKMIVDMCGQFLDAEVYPHLDKIDKQEKGLMVSLMEKAGEIGLLGISVPEEFGGFGKDFNTGTMVAEALGGGHSFPVSYMTHCGIGTLPILYFGTEDQKKKYLPTLASGEYKASYCLTEPNSGSDALASTTMAAPTKDGKHYILTGQKIWITNAGFADIFIVFAQVDGDKFTGFILEREMEGLTVGEEEHKMGIKGSSTCAVFLEDCKVPAENVLGEIGKGHLIAFNILNIGRFKLCAAALGGAKRASSLSISYANERKQFKQAISGFGAIKHKLAEQAIKIFAMESALYRTSNYINTKRKDILDEGKSYGDALLGGAKEYAVECAILKVLGSENLDWIIDEGVQVYGGYGYSEEYPMARAYRDARINRIFEGTNEINRLLIVDMLLKRAMKGELDLLGGAKAIQTELMSIPDMSASTDGPFDTQIKIVQNLKKAVLLTAGAAAQKFMQKLSGEQEIITDIADMIIATYASESALLRCQKTGSPKNQKKNALYILT